MCLPRAAYGKYHTFHTGSRQNLPAGQKWKLHARHLKIGIHGSRQVFRFDLKHLTGIISRI